MLRNSLLVVLLLPCLAFSGETGYTCTIKQIREISKSGEIVSHKGMYKNLVGSYFTINRENGEMVGPPFSTQSYRKVTVLDKGSKDSSYKAIVISHPPNLWIKYIYVAEFQRTNEKPFWGTDDGDKILSGLCE